MDEPLILRVRPGLTHDIEDITNSPTSTPLEFLEHQESVLYRANESLWTCRSCKTTWDSIKSKRRCGTSGCDTIQPHAEPAATPHQVLQHHSYLDLMLFGHFFDTPPRRLTPYVQHAMEAYLVAYPEAPKQHSAQVHVRYSLVCKAWAVSAQSQATNKSTAPLIPRCVSHRADCRISSLITGLPTLPLNMR